MSLRKQKVVGTPDYVEIMVVVHRLGAMEIICVFFSVLWLCFVLNPVSLLSSEYPYDIKSSRFHDVYLNTGYLLFISLLFF